MTSSTDERLAKMSLRPRTHHPVPREGLPHGPRGPAIVQSAALMKFRHQFVPWLKKTYGDVATVKLLPEGRPLVLFSRTETTKEIFGSDPEVFHAGKGNAVLGPIMGEHSLLLVDGAQHKRARKLLMPAFRPSAMQGYRTLVEEIAKEEVASWRPGEEFRSLERMNALTLEVILRVVFGVADESRLAKLRPLVNATVDVRPIVLLGWGYPKLQKFGPWKKVVEVQRALDELLYAEIRERRAAPDVAERTDVLSQLLLVGDHEGEAPLTDEELRDQLVTLLLAGHETTASGLAWALYELGRHPELMRRAQEAAATGDDDYLEAVMKESLRLHPIIPMVVRFLMKPARVGGHDLPSGISVGPSILLAHRDPANFPQPDEFRPTRFLDEEIKPNTWIPFGGGVRRCIGAGFSLMEGVVALREVLSSYDVSVVAGHDDTPRVRNITSVPDKGARIVVTPREA
jgi:cytochrome P450